jgi:hypothetical protein
VEAEEIYKLLQNLSYVAGTESTEEDILNQYRQRKQAHAAHAASSAQQHARWSAEQRSQQQSKDAAVKLREQMERMERMASQRAEAERKSAGNSHSHNALQTLAVLAADREVRELTTRYNLPPQSVEVGRIKQLLVRRGMVSGAEWSASGEAELAGLIYDCKLGLAGDVGAVSARCAPITGCTYTQYCQRIIRTTFCTTGSAEAK